MSSDNWDFLSQDPPPGAQNMSFSRRTAIISDATSKYGQEGANLAAGLTSRDQNIWDRGMIWNFLAGRR